MGVSFGKNQKDTPTPCPPKDRLPYGLAAAGEKGASAVLDIFQDEMSRTLANLGCASVDGLSAELNRPGYRGGSIF
ncbi:alpha-hydroxy-acid oxidizing protein [Pseudomonas asplenii]|uniref:alpha-hydroxy-acid oxidizing protein n=1 Tax=Pseudomonas asplenii TaxID=53407 RepID=UPI003CC7E8C7